MNQEQALNILRTFLQIAGSLIVGWNLFGITAADWTVFAGAVLMAFPAVWGVLSRRNSSMKLAVAAMPNTLVVHTEEAVPIATANRMAALPEVKNILTTQAVADATPSAKVTAAEPQQK